MKAIKFNRHYRAYNPGEVAHFDDELADHLISVKVAEPCEAGAAVSDDKTAKTERLMNRKDKHALQD